jgi:putative endonuclease
MALHNEIGKIGESICCSYLKRKGFSVIERNFRKKIGEIDIVARETNGKVHFIEVKTVSYETKKQLDQSVSHGTWRPEENVHAKKQFRFGKTIEIWLAEHRYTGDWQIDVLSLRMVWNEKYGRVQFIENVIFE